MTGFPIADGDYFLTVEQVRSIWNGIHELAVRWYDFTSDTRDGPDFARFDEAFPAAAAHGLFALIPSVHRRNFGGHQPRNYGMRGMQANGFIDWRSLQTETQRWGRLGQMARSTSTAVQLEDAEIPRSWPRQVAAPDSPGSPGQHAYVSNLPVHVRGATGWVPVEPTLVDGLPTKPPVDLLDTPGLAGSDVPQDMDPYQWSEYLDHRMWNKLAAHIDAALG